MTTLISFIRHGTPVGGNRYRGSSIDDPLSEKGWQQMFTGIENLPTADLVISSPMTRCRAFAEKYSEQHKLPQPLIDDRLKEIGFGSWEGKSSAEVLSEDEDAIRRFYHDPVNRRPAGAEPLSDFCRRVEDSLTEMLNTHKNRHILAVAHAGVMRAVVTIVLQAPLASMYKIGVNNAAVIGVKDDGIRPVTLVLD